MNPLTRFILLTIAAAQLGGVAPVSGDQHTVERLVVFTPAKIEQSFKSLGINQEDAYQLDGQTIVVTGTATEGDHALDYGARFFVIQDRDLAYRSKGMMDSWYLELTFFRSNTTAKPFLIIAETGDEGGSYGISVYELMNAQVKHLGYIDAGILDEETILTAVPHLRIEEHSGRYEFTFSKDVAIQDPNTGKYTTMPKGSLKFVYDGGEGIRITINPASGS